MTKYAYMPFACNGTSSTRFVHTIFTLVIVVAVGGRDAENIAEHKPFMWPMRTYRYVNAEKRKQARERARVN